VIFFSTFRQHLELGPHLSRVLDDMFVSPQSESDRAMEWEATVEATNLLKKQPEPLSQIN